MSDRPQQTGHAASGYPAMSHPSADPAVNAVAARLVGLEVNDPSRASILDLGCASGHHLLALASRWPDARCVGVDHDAGAIDFARVLAGEAGLANVEFVAADLVGFQGGGRFDYVIAHGVFSWVPDRVKLALLRQIANHLAPAGVAVVSFNVAAGWRRRFPVIQKVRAIQQAGRDVELLHALMVLRDVSENGAERVIADDMVAKGSAVLAHDDFAPVCDAFSLTDFVALAAHHGLRWLGEGVPGENAPVGGAAVGASRQAGDVVSVQNALDEAGGRTFRSALLCRDDVVLPERVPASVVADFFLTKGAHPYRGDARLMRESEAAAPRDVAVADLIRRYGPSIASTVVDNLYQGAVSARTHPAAVRHEVPERPRMDEFRLTCARRALPIVDARHIPCAFPAGQLAVLALMDGTRDWQALRAACPVEFDFTSWMRHLTERGFFI